MDSKRTYCECQSKRRAQYGERNEATGIQHADIWNFDEKRRGKKIETFLVSIDRIGFSCDVYGSVGKVH